MGWDKAVVEIEKIEQQQSQQIVTHVESSITHQKLLKKPRKEKMIEEKKEKVIDNLVMKKHLKSFDIVK